MDFCVNNLYNKMANLDELIVSLAKGAGIDPETNEALKTIRSNEALAKIEVDTTLKNVLLNNLMNMDSAKNNPSLLEHFKGKIGDEYLATKLNGIDALIEKMTDEFELSDESKGKVKTADRTNKKLTALRDELRNEYEKKGTSSKDKETLLSEIQKLNAAILQEKTNSTELVKAKENELLGKMQAKDYNLILESYNYATDNMDRETAKIVADTKLNKLLAEKGWVKQYSPDSADLFKVVTTTGTEAFDQNQPVQFKKLLDSVITDGKLLRVSGGGGDTTQTTTQKTMTTQTPKQNSSIAEAAAAMEKQIASMSGS